MVEKILGRESHCRKTAAEMVGKGFWDKSAPVLNTHAHNPHHILVKIQAANKIVSCVSPARCNPFCDIVLSVLKVIFSREFPSLWCLQKSLQAFGLKNIGYEITSCEVLLFRLVLFNCLYLVYPHLFLF